MIILFLLQAVRVLLSVLFGLICDVIFAETTAIGALAVIVLSTQCLSLYNRVLCGSATSA